MSSLYERVEHMEHLRGMLTQDMDALRTLFEHLTIADAPTPLQEAAKRSYVRAFFALVEALTEQHSQLLVDLARDGNIRLASDNVLALSDQTVDVTDTGKLRSRSMHLPIKSRLRLLYRLAPEALGETIAVDFSGSGWSNFGKALDFRHALVHPKRPQDCYVDEDELAILDSAREWHQMAHNQLVEAIRLHRGRVHW